MSIHIVQNLKINLTFSESFHFCERHKDNLLHANYRDKYTFHVPDVEVSDRIV